MAGAGKKTFTAGEVLTASDVNTYLMEQSVMVFGGTAARSSAIPTPSAGMTSYRTDAQQIESYNGTSWVGMGGLQLIKTQSIGTGVSSVTVTGAFSATYDNYKICVNGGSSSVNGVNVGLKLGSSTSNYYGVLMYASYAGAYQTGAGNNPSTAGFEYIANFNNNSNNFECDLLNPFIAQWTGIRSSYFALTSAGQYIGSHQVNSSFTSFTLTPASGTISGGTIAVYGYAK